MEGVLVVGWFSPSEEGIDWQHLLAQELPGARIVLFSQVREAQSFIERSILQGEEIFLFVAQLPEGQHFLEESLARWPLASGIGLLRRGALPPTSPVSYEVLPAEDQGERLRLHLQLLFRRYQERRAYERKNQILSELHRVSLSLTGEVRLDWLIFKLLRLSLENSGAEAGFLIVPDPLQDTALRVVGYAEATHHEPQPYTPRLLAEEPLIFVPAVEHVARSRENLFVSDTEESLWLRHPDWERSGIRELLCLPLVYQGRLIGILYLWQSHQTLQITPEKNEFLKLFTAPAAVALQNAQLYAEMEARVQERTQEVIRQKEEIERQSLLLRQQNEDIMASLRYAQRVQRAIFPPWSELQRVFPESFLFYQPREIVGGDFYWFAQRLSKVIIAVGDCTGHGIPGAFMTIVANTLLKQIVELEGVFKPSEVLYLLNLRMRAALQHEEALYQRFQEGMELALIQLDAKRHKLLYAGAGRPLFLVRDGKGTELRPDRVTIGAPYEGEAPEFTLHSIDLVPGQMLYLFSDGFTDQMNPESKRYQLRRLYEFFELVAEQTTAQQGLLLEAEFQRWASGTRQTDDIVVLGLRVP